MPKQVHLHADGCCKEVKPGEITASCLDGELMTGTFVLACPQDGLPEIHPGSLLLAKTGCRDAPLGPLRHSHRVCMETGSVWPQ